MNRLYHIVVINENTGEKVYVSDTTKPLTHKEACTIMFKMTQYKWRRIQLEEVV